MPSIENTGEILWVFDNYDWLSVTQTEPYIIDDFYSDYGENEDLHDEENGQLIIR